MTTTTDIKTVEKQGRSDLVDLTMQLHHETERAVLVSDDGVEENAVWLPLSQIEWEMKERKTQTIIVTLPEWLATDKGLV